MTKENIYYPDDNAFDRFYKRARYQANSFVAGKFGSKAADLLTTVPDFAYLICKLMLDPDVPSSRKLDLGLALLYVLSPLDLVPDSVPLLGKLDIILPFWDADDEFPPAMRVKWDTHVLAYLRYETTYYAVNCLWQRLLERMTP